MPDYFFMFQVIDSLEDIKLEIGCTKSQILEILQTFLQCVANLAVAIHQDSVKNFVTEGVYNHLWMLKDGNFPSKEDTCACGQYSAAGVNDSSWGFLSKSVSNLILESNEIPGNGNYKSEKSVKKLLILDELTSKTNAYSVAFETASLLLRVTVSIKS